MPSSIATFGELDRRLHAALHGETRGGRRPPQALRDELDFGQLASRHVHPIEPALARDLYEIASWVAYA